jgi:hypothetical protein
MNGAVTLALLPQLADQARAALGPDPHLKRLLLHLDPLDKELSDPRLHGGEELTCCSPSGAHAKIAADVGRYLQTLGRSPLLVDIED